MSNKDEPVMVYTTESVKEEIKKRADQEGMSVSAWCGQVIEDELADQALEESADRIGLEDRLDRMLGRTEDRVDRMLRQSVASDSIDAVYARALWELFRTEFTPKQRKDALVTAIDHVEDESSGTVDLDPDDPLEAEERQEADATPADSDPATSPTDASSASDSTADDSGDDDDDPWFV